MSGLNKAIEEQNQDGIVVDKKVQTIYLFVLLTVKNDYISFK